MAYNNQNQNNGGQAYDKSKDVVFLKVSANPTGKRYLNIEVYSYNSGTTKIRIRPAGANTNPNAEPNKKWISQPGISGITKEEAKSLIDSLTKAVNCPEL